MLGYQVQIAHSRTKCYAAFLFRGLVLSCCILCFSVSGTLVDESDPAFQDLLQSSGRKGEEGSGAEDEEDEDQDVVEPFDIGVETGDITAKAKADGACRTGTRGGVAEYPRAPGAVPKLPRYLGA
jgi:hypothetical protein